MIGVLAVGAEELLLVPDPSSIAASRPVQEGIQLLSALDQGLPVSRLRVMAHTADEQRLAFWCQMNGLTNADVTVPPAEDLVLSWEESQWKSVCRIRSHGPVWLVATASTYVFTKCQRAHQTAVLFGRRGLIEDLGAVESWEQLSERQKRHREAEVEQDAERRSQPPVE